MSDGLLKLLLMDIAKQSQENLMRWAARASVTVALVLVGAKAIAWWLSSSAAMLGSLADSSLDLMASLVTLFAVRHALMPADDDHRFGHGKVEALAGLFQSAIMTGSAVFILLESSKLIMNPVMVSHSDLVMGVSVLAIILSLALVMFQSHVVRRTGSIAISGDHLHYKGDLLLNLAVVVAAYLSLQGMLWADGTFGVIIALYIIWSARAVALPAIDMLMDKEFSPDDRERIFNLVMGSPDVLGLHELRTRSAGRDQFIQMHIEVGAELPVRKAHFIADEVEATLGEEFPGADILIHIDPPSVRSDELTRKELG